MQPIGEIWGEGIANLNHLIAGVTTTQWMIVGAVVVAGVFFFCKKS